MYECGSDKFASFRRSLLASGHLRSTMRLISRVRRLSLEADGCVRICLDAPQWRVANLPSVVTDLSRYVDGTAESRCYVLLGHASVCETKRTELQLLVILMISWQRSVGESLSSRNTHNATYLIDSVSGICSSKRLSHACSHNSIMSEAAHGSLARFRPFSDIPLG